jgi:uncharacterized repeat protein (TIGR03803 family)
MKTLRIPLIMALLVGVGGASQANDHTETILHSFGGSPNDGSYPYSAGLVQGSDGYFYGTTAGGGSNDIANGGDGTVFRISPSGRETTLYSFGSSPTDGVGPAAGLVQGRHGYFYGTTTGGGANNYGTVFRISASGTYTSLYSFGSSLNDGVYPYDVLVQGSDGNLYGTTYYGGSNNIANLGDGTVFRISPSGTYTTLYSFGSSPTDGANPYAGLVQGCDGNLYGTTLFGGSNNIASGGDGTVFRISASGREKTLYSFGSSPTDGVYPYAGLVQGCDGNLYGTTLFGGANNIANGGDGTVFRISPSGREKTLYSFGSSPTDGVLPVAGLVQGCDGNLYGTTESGGANNIANGGDGAVFRISPGGSYSSLYSFDGPPGDGNGPDAVLVQGSDGNLYGTTNNGGTNDEGTVFKLTVPRRR